MTPASPLVSIVTPSYNQAQFLEETMQSVLGQDYPRVEYIVIDGGSTDGSADIIRKHAPRLAYWVSERDAGQTDAIRKGFARATGDIVAWLNSDDVYFSRTTISEVVDAFRRRPDAGVVYGDTVLMNQRGVMYRMLPSMRRISLTRLGFYCLSQGASFMRRDVVQRYALRPELHYRMDYEYWMRLCAADVRFAYVPKIWEAFRVHPQSKTFETGCGLDDELRQIKRQYLHGAWQARWPFEPVLRRSVGAWLRLRGLVRAGELYATELAFQGIRLPKPVFYRHQLLSRTFSCV